MKSGTDIRSYFFYGLLLLLFVPWIQSIWKPIRVKELRGGIETIVVPNLNEINWFEGRYQHYKEASLNSEFGFRSSFVRLHNQIDFYLFDALHAKSVLRGKDNYLYEYNYITAYYGRDFIGKDSIRRRMSRLQNIQRILESHDKKLILGFAASKGQFYPEYFPDSIQYKKDSTNYEWFRFYADSFQIPAIDYNAWFLSMKYISQIPLYPKYGIHWSHYGACLVADSLIHDIEHYLQEDLPELDWSEIEWDSPRYDDNDIEKGLNLMLPLPGPKLAYPKCHFENDPQKNRPNVMVIADSYYWSLFNLGVFNSFHKNFFWYYFNEVYQPGNLPMLKGNENLFIDQLRESDLVFILSTDANLNRLGWGFIEQAEWVLSQKRYMKSDYQSRVQALIDYIPKDSAWIKHIREKALKMNVGVDSILRMDARWMIDQEGK